MALKFQASSRLIFYRANSKRLVGLLLVLSWAAGCMPVDREKLTKEVTAKDPAFGMVLEKHREIASRIQTFDRELSVRRSEVEKKINQLRKDLVDAASSVRAKSEEARKRMEPDRQRLQSELAQTANDLRIKREQRSTLGKEVAFLKKSGQEQPSDKLQGLLKQAAAVDEDLASLKDRVRLIKIKLLLIKL